MNMRWVFRYVLNRLISKGINTGIDHASRGGKSERDLDPDEKAKARKTRKTMKHATRMAQILRRLGR